MAIISNTAPYTPPANLNTAALSITKVQPAGIFDSANSFSLGGISSIFSQNSSLALAPSKINIVPAITPSTVGSVYTSTAPTSLTAAASTGQPSSFLQGLSSIATGVLNIGANVLLNKYAPQSQPATVASQSTSVPSSQTSPQTQVFQNGQPIDTGLNSLLNSLGNAFVSRQQVQTAQGTQVVSSPSMLTYALIGGAIILIVLLMRRK